MSRYIDADKLKLDWLFRGKDGKPYRDTIDEQPTADVVEVVHGKWNYKGLDFNIDSLYQCSACSHYHWAKSNFCPNCGADMRERREDDKGRNTTSI